MSVQGPRPYKLAPEGGTPDFLVGNISLKITNPRKIGPGEKPEEKNRKKPGPDKSAILFNVNNKFGRKMNSDGL